LSRRSFLRAVVIGSAGVFAAACQSKVVEKIVKETVVVQSSPEVVKETVVVKSTPEVVKQTVVVEKAAKAKGELVVWGWPWYNSKLPMQFQMAAQYNETFPDEPTIKFLSKNYEWPTVIMDARAGRATADVLSVMLPYMDLASLTGGDVIIPLDEFVDADMKAKSYPTYWDLFTYKGKLWGLPIMAGGEDLEGRKSYLTAAGHPKGPGETWDEYVATLEDIKGKKIAGPDGKPIWPHVIDMRYDRTFITIAASRAGAENLWDERGVPNWDNPALAEAMDILKKLSTYAPEEIYQPGWPLFDLMGTGTVAMCMGNALLITEIAKKTFGLGDLDVWIPPKFSDSKYDRWVSTWGQGGAVNKYGNKEAAIKFLKWQWNQEAFHQAIASVWCSIYKPFETADWMLPYMKTLQNGWGEHGIFAPPSLYYTPVASMITANDYCQGKIATAAEAIATWKKNAEDAITKA
jgi:ABC-type glycerol-3-phosphate transport system substrate-binding protein